MKKLKIIITLAMAALTLAACAPNTTGKLALKNANKQMEKSGSPYRWAIVGETPQGLLMEKTVVGTPGPTVADETVQRDIIIDILAADKKSGATSKLTLTEFRQVQPGPKTFVEAWVFDRNKKKVVYLVTMAEAPQGGVDFSITGPWL